jgi:hypothetical protein
MKRMNPSQTGKAAELRFSSLVILGARGEIELVPPVADDERRDFELHLRHHFGRPLSLQVKVVTTLVRGNTLRVQTFYGHRQPVDEAYWFFVAYLDLKTFDYADPMFLIPSKELRQNGRLRTQICPSIRAGARDRWVKYRVTRLELGSRLHQELLRLNIGKDVAA